MACEGTDKKIVASCFFYSVSKLNDCYRLFAERRGECEEKRGKKSANDFPTNYQ